MYNSKEFCPTVHMYYADSFQMANLITKQINEALKAKLGFEETSL